MKISNILLFMGVEFTIRGDVEYDESVNLDELDADWPKGRPSNEEFHAAVLPYIAEEEKRRIAAEKELSYPNVTAWLLALTKQLELISGNAPICDEFRDLKTALDDIEAKYELK